MPRRLPAPGVVLDLAVLAVGLLFALRAIATCFQLKVALPFVDWLSIQDYFFRAVEAGRTAQFVLRPCPANEHLLWLPMPFFLADDVLFRARGDFLLVVNLALNGALALQVARAAGRAAPALGRAGRALVFALTLDLLLWFVHWANLLFPMQVIVYLSIACFAAAAAAFVHLDAALRAGARRDALRAAVVLALALTGSTFSFGYGLAGWVACVVVAALRRWRPLALAALAGGALATFTVYLHLMSPIPPAAMPLLPRIAGTAAYVTHFVADPLRTGAAALLPAGAAGVFALVATVAALLASAWLLIRPRRPPAPGAGGALFFDLLIAFTLACAAITAQARMAGGSEQAEASRYAIVSVLFWLAFAARGLPALATRGALLARAPALFGCLVLPALLRTQPDLVAPIAAAHPRLVRPEMAFLNDVVDPSVTEHVATSSEVFRHVARSMRARGWSLFSGPQGAWIGRPLAATFDVVDAAGLRGATTRSQPVASDPGVTNLEGFAFDATDGAVPTWLVLVDAVGTIRGVAKTGLPARNAALDAGWARVAGAAPDGPGWFGYARAADAVPGGFTAYAVASDGRRAMRLPDQAR